MSRFPRRILTLILIAAFSSGYSAETPTPAAGQPKAAVTPKISPEQLQNLRAWADEFQIPAKALPRSAEALLALTELDLNRNPYGKYKNYPKLTYLPPEIGQLHNLQKLFLSDNKLQQLPAEITRLKKLKELSIRQNPNLRLTPAQERFLKSIPKVKRD